MINKRNWNLVKRYLQYRLHEDQISPSSLKIEETYLRYFIEWADSVHFSKVQSKIPTFPEYMRMARHDGKDGPLSAMHIKKILSAARRMLFWLKENDKDSRTLKIDWINKMKTKRLTEIPQTKEYVTYDEIIQIAWSPVKNTQERRIRAALVFMYLTGIRVGAFVTLPIKAVDIGNRFVYQYPSLGVHTKNNKSARTVIFPIKELIEIISNWDKEIRSVLPEDGYWFAPLSPETGDIDQNNLSSNDTRVAIVRKNSKEWLDKNGLTYHSPHKFRHGHVHYGQALSRTQEEYKAVSQNVMHSTTGITDQFYSNMDDLEKRARLDSMFENKKENNCTEEYQAFIQFLRWKDLNKK